MYFRDQKVDLAVIETGIGGRLDATNVVDPLASVVTSIGFDHCELLGDTIEKIAFEKAGIIKPGRPVILGPELPTEYLADIARSRGSPVFKVLPARSFQMTHNEISKKCVEVVCAMHPSKFAVPRAALDYACSCRQPCRLEYVPKEMVLRALKQETAPNFVVLDVGHNKPALVRSGCEIVAG